MISTAIINLSIIGAFFLILLFYSIRFVLRYKHQYESNPLCTSAVLFCLFVVLLTTFILPIDIFLVSFVKEPDGSFKQWATNETLASIDKAVFGAYYALYGVIMISTFCLIPFLHFLNEESESNSRDRLYKSIKFTFAFSMVAAALLVFGALLHSGDVDPNLIFNKILHIIQTTKFQNAATMVMTFLTMAGFVNVSFYTASGIFSWPISLIFGTSSVEERTGGVADRETILRTRISTLKEKARGFGLSPTEQEQLLKAETDLRELEREQIALAGYSNSTTYKWRKVIRPLQKLCGAIFAILAVFLVVTLILVNVDRILHGAGSRQGYILVEPQIFNLLDYVYRKIEDYVIIGPMPLLIVLSFLIVATISGIRNLGLWLLFSRLHRLKVGRTPPQALLFFCITIMLTAISFNLILYSMTTEYVTFGNQNFKQTTNGTVSVKQCSFNELNGENSSCILTRSSVLLMRMMAQLWVFGTIFYWSSWVFVVVSVLSLVAYLVRGKRGATHGIITDEDEFED